MRSFVGAALAALFLSGGTAATTSCSPCSVSGQEAIVYADGDVNPSKTVYQTGDVDEEMLHFPQGRTYELVHGLGSTPEDVNIFLSFRSRLTSSGDPDDKEAPNNVSPSAGNQAVIEVWNDEVVTIRNDTCAEFYVRVVITDFPDLNAEGELGGTAGATN